MKFFRKNRKKINFQGLRAERLAWTDLRSLLRQLLKILHGAGSNSKKLGFSSIFHGLIEKCQHLKKRQSVGHQQRLSRPGLSKGYKIVIFECHLRGIRQIVKKTSQPAKNDPEIDFSRSRPARSVLVMPSTQALFSLSEILPCRKAAQSGF